MKYFLAVAVSFLILGCATSQNNTAPQNIQTKSVIVDEEFDLLVAPEYDYEREVPYSEQIKVNTKTTAVSASDKPEKSFVKPAAVKK